MRLFTEHVGLVKAMARSMQRRLSGVSIEDLRQDGYVGLLKAAQAFDPQRNVSFWVYARFRVRGAMLNGIETSRIGSSASADSEVALEPKVRDTMLARRVQECLAGFPCRDRRILELHLFHGLSQRETARSIGVCLDTVRKVVGKGLIDIRAACGPARRGSRAA